MTSVQDNLIDLIWLDQPARSTEIVKSLALEFTGKAEMGMK